jgi:hypothetical protein
MRKSGDYLVRALCKECQNARERGHRREWKRNYLRRWRKYNAELNESYWRDANARDRETINARARLRVAKHHHALLIQGRLRRRLGMHVTLAEAKKLLRRFGPCYPTQSGLSPKGVRAVERIRSRMRNRGGAYPVIAIRLIVYEDGLFIKPAEQKIPYRFAAQKLRAWHAARRKEG